MDDYDIAKDKDVLTQVKEIFSNELKELENSENATISEKRINLKGYPLKTIQEVLKYTMSVDNVVNYSVLTNLSILINGYSTLDESLFENPDIWFSSVEDVIDTKLDLSEEIVEFQTKIAFWLLAVLKSSSKTEYVYLDEFIPVPPEFKRILLSTPFLSLSHILSKAKNIQTKDLPLVRDGYPIVSEIAKKINLSFGLLGMISKEFEDRGKSM